MFFFFFIHEITNLSMAFVNVKDDDDDVADGDDDV